MEKPKNVKSGLLLFGALLIAVAALFVLGWLAEEVLEGGTQKFDTCVRTAGHRYATPGLTRLMLGFSFLGSVAVISVLWLVAICVFLYFRRARMAGLLGRAIGGAGGG